MCGWLKDIFDEIWFNNNFVVPQIRKFGPIPLFTQPFIIVAILINGAHSATRCLRGLAQAPGSLAPLKRETLADVYRTLLGQ